MKTTLTTLTLTLITSLLASNNASAESLKCREVRTFRQADMVINRDGAIGFNGTHIRLQASWFATPNFSTLDMLTGRPADKDFLTSSVSLYLSPSGACTANNNSLSEDFSCLVKNGEIDVVGNDQQNTSDGSAVIIEQTSKTLRVKVDVELNAKIQEITPSKRNIQLAATLTNTKTGQQIQLKERMECQVEK